MSIQDINDLIENPDALVVVDTQELMDFCTQYPYFQNLRFLLAKKQLLIQSSTYENMLNMAACYATDRAFLYNFLFEADHTEDTSATDQAFTEDGFNDNEADDVHDVDFELVVENELFEEQEHEEEEARANPMTDGEEHSFEKNIPAFEEDFLEEDEYEDDEGGSVSDDAAPVQSNNSLESLEEDIDLRVKNILTKIGSTPANDNLEEAILRIRNMRLGTNLQKKQVPTPTPPQSEKKIFQLETALDDAQGSLETRDLMGDFNINLVTEQEQSAITFLENEDDEDAPRNTEMERIRAQMRKKHMDKLQKSVDAFLNLEGKERQQEVGNALLLEIPDDISFKDWMLDVRNKVMHEDLRGEVNKQEEDLDNSLEEDDELMSEALAELLVMQGNNERAIEMYEHLILKFPEKKTFFAQKIIDLS